jgi:hypothetical protein
MASQNQRRSTGDRGNVTPLRGAIDRGRTGDKVDFPDPAAAPLGADDEAAGHPPSRAEIRVAAKHEVQDRRPLDADRRSRERRESMVTPLFVAGLVLAIALILVGVYTLG